MSTFVERIEKLLKLDERDIVLIQEGGIDRANERAATAHQGTVGGPRRPDAALCPYRGLRERMGVFLAFPRPARTMIPLVRLTASRRAVSAMWA